MASTDFSMIVRHPEEGLTRHDLTGDSITVGRGPDNDIQILVSEISVQHAEFSMAGDTPRLSDKGSTNGTTLNGQKVEAAGVDVTPMSKAILGATIDAYFVPSAVLDSTPMEELAATIDQNASEAKPKTAPVAVAAPAGPKPPVAVAAPAPATSGAQTVRLDQVKPPTKPGAPATPLKPPGAPQPGAPQPAAPAPGPPKPGVPQPGAAPAAPQLPTPAAPSPGGAPPAAPVPLKRPAPGGGPPPPAAPKAPNIALPKTPPKPGGE